MRRIFLLHVCVNPQVTILLRMEDKMNRQLTCSITENDTPEILVQELIHYGFINEVKELAFKTA